MDSRKRKLDYSRNKTLEWPNKTKTQIFKSSCSVKTGQVSVWQRATEGFSGFTAVDRGKPTRRKNLQARQPEKYRICMPCDSESEIEVENAIKWSSSEDDLSPLSDLEPTSDVTQIKPDDHIVQKRVKDSRVKDIQWQERIDFVDSDSELDVAQDQTLSSKDVRNKVSQNEADLIEDTDSRSSFTLSASDITKNKQQTNSEEIIEDIQVPSSTETSATSSSPSQKSKVKASDWVKSLDLKTPTKQSPNNVVLLKDDSAKKKKKYTRNGLADQLYKLQIRERSSVRMWYHQSVSEEKVSSRSVLVKVLDYELLHSLQLARCRELSTDLKSTHSDCYVLFSLETMEDLNISAGSVVRIFPPWQKLKLQSLNRTVILCTNYVRVEDHEPVEVEQNNFKTVCTVEWNCPCVTGLTWDHNLCPAIQFPWIPCVTLSQDYKTESSGSTSIQSQIEHSLYTIEDTQSSGTPSSSVSDSILESIDKSSLQTGICFKAVVHRTLCKYDTLTKVKRYSFLVEDGHGIMCEILTPDDSDKLLEDIIQNDEGNSYVFTGLRVLARTTRDRDPSLFSMIDSVWSGVNIMGVSEESETSSCSNMSQILPPGFCYTMVEHDRTNTDFKVTELSTAVATYKKPQLTLLEDLKQGCIVPKRVSLVVNVLARLHNTDLVNEINADFQCLLYVTDNSLSNTDYTIIRVKSSCYIPGSLDSIVLLRDVLLSNGNFLCDCYSEIQLDLERVAKKFDVYISKEHITCFPEKLEKNSEIYDLCTIKGQICEIDESSAFSWDVCDKCGLDKLAEKAKTREIVCLSCKRVVSHPVTKMRMEVYISVPDLNSYRIKVDLLEDTIKSLLPDEDNSEGYDVGSVLNSTVGPLWCVVTKKNHKEMFLKEIKTFS